MKTIGEKIYSLRKIKGLSQEELGFEIGVSRQTVSKWEASQVNPNIENIKQLCEVFNVSANYFFEEDEISIAPTINVTTEISEKAPNQSHKRILITLIIITSVLNALSIVLAGFIGSVIFNPDKWGVATSTLKIYSVLFIFLCVVIVISVIAEIIFICLFNSKKVKVNLS